MKTPLHEIVRERLALGAAVPAINCNGASTAGSVVEAAEAAGLRSSCWCRSWPLPWRDEDKSAMCAVADSATVPVSVQLDHASHPHLIAGPSV